MSQRQLPKIKTRNNSIGIYNGNCLQIKNYHNNTANYHQRKQLINRKYHWINHTILQNLQHHQYIQINLNNKVMLIKKKQTSQDCLQGNRQHSKDNNLNSAKDQLQRKDSHHKSLTFCKSKLNCKIKENKQNKRFLVGYAKRSFTESQYDNRYNDVRNDLRSKMRGLTQKLNTKEQEGLTQKLNKRQFIYKLNIKQQEYDVQPWKDDNKQNYESFQ